MLRPFPPGTQAEHGLQQRGRRQGALAEPVLVTDGGESCPGPGALRLAKVARALMEARLQVLSFCGRQDWGHAHRDMGPRPQTVQAPLGKGIEDIVNRLARASQVAGNRGGRLALGARQQNVATPYRKGIRGTTSTGQGRALMLREWSDKRLCFHNQYDTTTMAFCPMTLLKMH